MRGPREGIMGLRSSWMVVASAPLGHNFDSGRPECANSGHSPTGGARVKSREAT
jgi:hypothetical protein